MENFVKGIMRWARLKDGVFRNAAHLPCALCDKRLSRDEAIGHHIVARSNPDWADPMRAHTHDNLQIRCRACERVAHKVCQDGNPIDPDIGLSVAQWKLIRGCYEFRWQRREQRVQASPPKQARRRPAKPPEKNSTARLLEQLDNPCYHLPSGRRNAPPHTLYPRGQSRA